MDDLRARFGPALEAALAATLEHLDGLDRRPVLVRADPRKVRASLQKDLNVEPLAPEVVINELVRDSQGGIVGSAGGRFFGWVIGGCLPAALAADWLTSAWDQNATLYVSGPAAAMVEQI